MRQAQSASGSGGSGSGYPPRSGYDELDTTLMPPRPGEQYGRGGSPATAGSGGSGSAAMTASAAAGHPANPHASYVPAGGMFLLASTFSFTSFFIRRQQLLSSHFFL